MAETPQLFGNGMPVPFHGEMFVLARDGVEFHGGAAAACTGARARVHERTT